MKIDKNRKNKKARWKRGEKTEGFTGEKETVYMKKRENENKVKIGRPRGLEESTHSSHIRRL